MTSEIPGRIATLRRRASIVAALRAFFDRRGYLAVETPQLCRTPIPEAHIELFETHRAPHATAERDAGAPADAAPLATADSHADAAPLATADSHADVAPLATADSHADVAPLADAGAAPHATVDADTETSLWLLPSPEYYLKQLVAAGSGSLYEITHSFRNGEEVGRYHEIEFTMLEYYTVDGSSEDSLTITQELLQELGESAPPLILSMQEAWHQFTGIDLAATIRGPGSAVPGGDSAAAGAGNLATGSRSAATGADRPTPQPRRAPMVEAIQRAELSLSISAEDSWEDLFQRVFLTYIEPELPQDRPVFITDYPAAVSTLAQTKPGTPWADRWELYLGGVEVANCFGEETGPERIAAFFAEQNAEKATVGHRVHPVDRTYLHAPQLPRCSGVAMGVDRLVMYLVGAADVGEVMSFRP